jgi:glycosyltransferase involved in cell wall biosynthesis
MALGKTCSSLWWVLHLSPKKRGSMEDQLRALAQRLHAEKVALTCVFAEPPSRWLSAQLQRFGAQIRELDFTRPTQSALQLYRWLREARPELVHFHFVRAYSPLVAAARGTSATVALNDHVTLTNPFFSPLRQAFKWVRASALNRLCDVRVAVSEVVRKSVIEIEHVAANQVVVIENGIDVSRFAEADGKKLRRELGLVERPTVAVVSRLSSEKGVESALRMMLLLPSSFVLLVCGDGPEKSRFFKLAHELELGERVRFLGMRDDVEQLIAASDVVVAPSHWEEAFGLAVVEAMAAGRPVVASRSGAMPEILGDAGVVVPKKDPAALAHAVARLVEDPARRERLGHRGQARARQRFGMERYLDDLCRLYGRLRPSLFHEIAA